MTTKTATRIISANNGKTIKVTLERGVWDEEIRLDGMLCGTKPHLVNRTEITLYDGSKKLATSESLDPLPKRHNQLAQAIKAGCVAVIGRDCFVKQGSADAIRAALAELEVENPKTPEMIAMEQADAERERIGNENMARMAAEQREREAHIGWCKRCQDYTYGDCGH